MEQYYETLFSFHNGYKTIGKAVQKKVELAKEKGTTKEQVALANLLRIGIFALSFNQPSININFSSNEQKTSLDFNLIIRLKNEDKKTDEEEINMSQECKVS